IVEPLLGSRYNGLALSRIVLVMVGVIGVILAWNPPPLIGLFAQKGVYGLAAASIVPILFGVLVRRHIPLWVVLGAALLGLAAHLGLNLSGLVKNPAVSASYAIILALGYGLLGLLATRVGAPDKQIEYPPA
ncbi:MAG TPA: sodium:solute symporter family protein, partial [Kineobactrum sp.]